MSYIPVSFTSQRRYHFPTEKAETWRNITQFSKLPDEYLDISVCVPFSCSLAWDLVLFHPNVLHYSSKNAAEAGKGYPGYQPIVI